MMMVAQEKTRSYAKRALGDDFFPLSIETCGCLHSHFDSFFIVCAQTIIARHLQCFFNPFDTCFLLSIMHVYSLATCINHSDSLANYYIWSRFFIFSTHHN
jgi:hypothetical protein